MIRDITIGQYYPSESVLHDLDPRVKLISTFFFIISLFVFNTFYGYIVVTLFLYTIIRLSKVPFKFIFKGLRGIMVLLLFTAIFNLFLTPGEEIFKLGFLKITKEGIYTASFMAIRLSYLVLGSSIMTFVTTPNQLTDGLEEIMKPLNKIKLPVHEIALMMSIALRFIPILLEETDKIMKAQMARGADFESGNVLKRAKSLIPILVPLFISAFRRANDLAMAMEARCYHGGEGRTKMKPLMYKRNDYMAFSAFSLYITAVIGIKIIEKAL
ncbi:MAG TPA: energy-coupling factor transporter transmembrane protein EcfT [Clostridiales bacterium]|nr:energy-coupling factor transporter transmembrane protein EcfT [Clostridiales bacterium]